MPGRLVDHDQVLVLVGDNYGDILWNSLWIAGGGRWMEKLEPA